MKTALVTGGLGNLGVYVTQRLLDEGYEVTVLDNDGRRSELGREGSVWGNLEMFSKNPRFHFSGSDVSVIDWNRSDFKDGFDVIVHAASQVSHPRSIEIPMRDFEINALGTIKLLEYVRQHSHRSNFIYIGSAKVYGENVDKEPQRELSTRWDYDCLFSDSHYYNSSFRGIGEWCSIDQTMKTPFGCSKAYADLITQEWGKMYGLQTSVLRPSCFAGKFTKPTVYQRWEAYIMKQALQDQHVNVYGHGGKQVRDILHCDDLVNAIMMMVDDPPPSGEVYNIGGGRDNSISVLELLERVRDHEQMDIHTTILPRREGDWRVFVTDNSKLEKQYPDWKVTRSLNYIIDELYEPLSQIIQAESARRQSTR